MERRTRPVVDLSHARRYKRLHRFIEFHPLRSPWSAVSVSLRRRGAEDGGRVEIKLRCHGVKVVKGGRLSGSIFLWELRWWGLQLLVLSVAVSCAVLVKSSVLVVFI
jgi:hypothetical protein